MALMNTLMGMGIVAEGLDQVLDVRVQHGVAADSGSRPQLGGGGQLAEDDEVGGLQIGAVARQLLDGIAPVAQDALLAVDEGDGALVAAVLVRPGS